LLRYGFAYEKASQLRERPSRTPELPTDWISLSGDGKRIGLKPPTLTVNEITELGSLGKRAFHIAGTAHQDELDALHVNVDGIKQDDVKLVGSRWEMSVAIVCRWEGREEERGAPDPEKAMVIVVACGGMEGLLPR
jgi:amidase